MVCVIALTPQTNFARGLRDRAYRETDFQTGDAFAGAAKGFSGGDDASAVVANVFHAVDRALGRGR